VRQPGKNIMLGTAGHVDHGKTALVKLLTGCDTDTLAAEKARGLTIELGFAPCQMADKRIIGIVDMPGHVDFIRNMAAGAQGIDVVIFVIAADDGVMPQTREHMDILTLMGISRGLVALTKIDLAKDDELKALAVEDVRSFLRGTFLEDAPICPISNITGEGFDGFFQALNRVVDAAEPHEHEGLFRLWIERGFNIRGFGTVVSGIPTTGTVRVGDKLTLVPGGQVGRVRSMEVYGEPSDVGRAGECVALNVAGIEAELLTRGNVLCQADAFEAVSFFEAELTLLPGVRQPLKDYLEAHVHIGTAEAMANVALMEKSELVPGVPQLVQIRLCQPLCVAIGERFVIRASVPRLAEGRVTTVGGGRVLGASGVRLRRKRPWTIQLLSDRRAAIDDPAAWIAQCLAEAQTPLSAEALAKAAQRPAAKVASVLAELLKTGEAVELSPNQFAHRRSVERAAEAMVEAVKAFHEANPLRMGIEQAELAAQTGAGAIFDAALAQCLADGRLQLRGSVLGSPGQAGGLGPEDRALLERVETMLREAHLEPPLPETLAETLGQTPERIDEIIRLLVDAGSVLRLDRKVAMHRQAVDAAVKVVLDLFAKASSFETVEFRDALNVSRKFAVPLLDYFDTARLTVRSGSRRRPGVKAREALGQK
jgi:selenocysteine-specific elongation factor